MFKYNILTALFFTWIWVSFIFFKFNWLVFYDELKNVTYTRAVSIMVGGNRGGWNPASQDIKQPLILKEKKGCGTQSMQKFPQMLSSVFWLSFLKQTDV